MLLTTLLSFEQLGPDIQIQGKCRSYKMIRKGKSVKSYSEQIVANIRNISEDTQEMPQIPNVAQTFQGIKRRREKIMAKQTSHLKPPTQEQRRTASEELPWNHQ